MTSNNTTSSSSSSTRPSTSTPTPSTTTTTTEEQETEQLMKDAVLALSAIAGAFLLLKALAASITVYLAMLPVAFIYGLNTCPPTNSFDAKQQLRMVFSGDQLPPDHPDKPKPGNSFGQFFAQAKAAITSELATLPGYEVTMTSLAGAAFFATVTMPSADLECYWLGCNHRWYYWGSKKLSEVNNVAVAGVSNNREGVNVFKAPESANFKIGKTNIKFDFGNNGKQD